MLKLSGRVGAEDSFNPCFSGSCIRMSFKVHRGVVDISFNPCFSGSCIRILNAEMENAGVLSEFQSLF